MRRGHGLAASARSAGGRGRAPGYGESRGCGSAPGRGQEGSREPARRPGAAGGPGESLCSRPGAAHKGRPRSPACGAGPAPACCGAGGGERGRAEPCGAERRGAAASSVVTHRGGPTRQGGTEGGAWAAPGEGPAASPRPGQRRRRRHHPRAGREEGAGPGWKGRDRSGGVVRREGGGTWWKGAGPPATVDTGCSRALTCVQPFLQCRMSPRAPSFLLAVLGSAAGLRSTAPVVLNQTNRVHVRPGEWLLS